MNRLGIIIDLAHASMATMKAVLQLSKAPVVFSHSSAYSVCQHRRNVPDDVLQLVVRGWAGAVRSWAGPRGLAALPTVPPSFPSRRRRAAW